MLFRSVRASSTQEASFGFLETHELKDDLRAWQQWERRAADLQHPLHAPSAPQRSTAHDLFMGDAGSTSIDMLLSDEGKYLPDDVWRTALREAQSAVACVVSSENPHLADVSAAADAAEAFADLLFLGGERVAFDATPEAMPRLHLLAQSAQRVAKDFRRFTNEVSA